MNFTDNIEDLEDLLRGVHKRMQENKTYTEPKPPKKYKNPNPYTPAEDNTQVLPMHVNNKGKWSI